MTNGTQSIRVVKGKNGRLLKKVCCAGAVRMLRVAFYFRWTTIETFNEERAERAAKRHGRGILYGDALHAVFGLPDVRDNRLNRFTTRRKTGHGHRRTHQLDELTACCSSVSFGGRAIGCSGEKLPSVHLTEILGSFQVADAAPEPVAGFVTLFRAVVKYRKLDHDNVFRCAVASGDHADQ
jgi:hypothetical protein